MSTATTKYSNVETPVTIEGEEVRETIDEIIGNEPDIADHNGGNGEVKVLEDNEAQEDSGPPEIQGKPRLRAEAKEEAFMRIVRETIEEITPHYQRAVEITQEQRDRYREIGLIVIRRRNEAGSYGSKLLDELADHFGIGEWSLRAMADYAKVDPHGEAIPTELIDLSWRRVVKCAQRAKTEERFADLLENNPQVLTQSDEDFTVFLRTEFPSRKARGRRPNNGGEPLDTTDAENDANSLGGNGSTNPPAPSRSKSAKLPPIVEQAFNDLVSAEDSPWKGEVNVYAGEEGCFAFQATFKTEEECVTVFNHFIDHLTKEAA